MGHQLKDAGGHPTPKFQCGQDRCEAEFILILDICSYGTLFAIYGPELSKDKRMEEGTHVQHGGLRRNERKSCYLPVGWAAPRSPPAWLQPSKGHSQSTASSSDQRLKDLAPGYTLMSHHLKTSCPSLGQWECAQRTKHLPKEKTP